ncbi:Replication protein A 32 kDa subunit A [Citrus sinensis]|uniref:Replication protein A 32 kDa subunit A n=1 Tax=Citrus sinensis TaxID=2711 RepID=A0ACB8NL81_CITSI|nr:Replication protein A 32 kDa subunit A [Citrus sinensis]KAH9798531.1 Replication protein A 32 kDa subunit A [Citrus sinensis]
MFSSSQFDASNAFSGGGFMPSQPPQSADYPSSTARSRDSQGLVPVTVKMISEASHSGDDKSNFMINGLEITNVTLVGLVYNKEERASDVNFTLDDGTGRVVCKRWASEVFDTREMEAIQPVTNFDEVTCHYIECIYFHLQNSKSQVQGFPSSQPQMVDSSLNTSARTGLSGYQTAPTNLSSQFGVDGLKDCDQMILDYLQQPSSSERERGVHVNELSEQLKIPQKKIMDSIASLENEGLIYSTIDEFHYKFARG